MNAPALCHDLPFSLGGKKRALVPRLLPGNAVSSRLQPRQRSYRAPRQRRLEPRGTECVTRQEPCNERAWCNRGSCPTINAALWPPARLRMTTFGAPFSLLRPNCKLVSNGKSPVPPVATHSHRSHFRSLAFSDCSSHFGERPRANSSHANDAGAPLFGLPTDPGL